MIRALSIASVLSFAVFSMGAAFAQDAPAPAAPAAEKKPGPADGFTLHVMAPHKFEDGTVHGPYHHYCKGISPEILQCLLFESTDPNARLTDVEYFVAKSVSRKDVPLKAWNKYYHDHEVEIATGRVQILDMPEAQAKEVAAVPLRRTGSSSISAGWSEGAHRCGWPSAIGRPQASNQVSSAGCGEKISLVCLVSLVYLVYLVCLVEPDRPGRPSRPMNMIFWRGEPGNRFSSLCLYLVRRRTFVMTNRIGITSIITLVIGALLITEGLIWAG